MKLLLFDIDGTLLHTEGLGRRVVSGVLTEQLGRPVDPHGTSFSGKTDPQIFRDLLLLEQEAGYALDSLDGAVELALEAYEGRMDAALKTATVTALPGTLDLIPRLAAHEGVLLGLLTGNLQSLAYGKLERAGFSTSHFVSGLGAFGSDHADRDCLGPYALDRAAAHTGRPFTGAETIVIGDTPRDVACARAFGATAVGVTTGAYGRDELAEADLVLDSLVDAEPLLRLIEGRA